MKMNLNIFQNAKISQGIEVVSQADGNSLYRCCRLQLRSSTISVEELITDISDFGELCEWLNSDAPVQVTFTGKGTMFRSIAKSESTTPEAALATILPNANPSDFYVQIYDRENDGAYVSLIRKELVDVLLARLKDAGFSVTAVYIGPYSLHSILPILMEQGVQELYTGHVHVLHNGRSIEQLSPSDDTPLIETKIGEEVIPIGALVSFSSALGYLAGSAASVRDNMDDVHFMADEYVQKKLFKRRSTFAAAFFFVLLSVNFLFFNHYYNQKIILEDRTRSSGTMLSEFDSLQSVLKERTELVNKAGLVGSSKLSFYADRLASGIPTKLQLTRMQIYPIIPRTDDNDRPEFAIGSIRVVGKCFEGTELNMWIQLLKQESFTSEVNLVSFKQEEKNLPGIFTVDISI